MPELALAVKTIAMSCYLQRRFTSYHANKAARLPIADAASALSTPCERKDESEPGRAFRCPGRS